ncbi:MAG: hypothetical protein ACK5O9_06140 [Holosporales bacterium]
MSLFSAEDLYTDINDFRFIGDKQQHSQIQQRLIAEMKNHSLSLLVGPQRTGKDTVERQIRSSAKADGIIVLCTDPGSSVSRLREKKEENSDGTFIISLGEINFYSNEEYPAICSFAQKEQIPMVGNLSIPPGIAAPWDQVAIEKSWQSFMENSKTATPPGLELSLPQGAGIYFLPMDPQQCAWKFWSIKDRAAEDAEDLFEFHGAREIWRNYGEFHMYIPEFNNTRLQWLRKTEDKFFEDLGKIMNCKLETYTDMNTRLMLTNPNLKTSTK